MYGAGKDFPLEDDEILKINSPKEHVSGPYSVVYKNIQERWAIVALHWENEPRLGMRWFWEGGGNPFSSGHATWLIVPPTLSKSVLAGLPIEHIRAGRVEDFLCGRIESSELNG